MSSRLPEMLHSTNEEMQSFLRRAHEVSASSCALDATQVKSLRTRLAALDEAARASSPEEISAVRTFGMYGEYRELLSQVQREIKPLRGRLLTRRARIRMARARLQSAQAWISALDLTR